MKNGSFGLDSISHIEYFHQVEHQPPITGMFIFHTTGPKLYIRYTIFAFSLGLSDLKYNRSQATILKLVRQKSMSHKVLGFPENVQKCNMHPYSPENMLL